MVLERTWKLHFQHEQLSLYTCVGSDSRFLGERGYVPLHISGYLPQQGQAPGA